MSNAWTDAGFAKSKPNAETRVESLDFLRGIAILGVIAVHCVGAFPSSFVLLDSLMRLGRYGVQLFFVASAFTMVMMWERRVGTDHEPVLAFYVRRAARIIPMFWVAAIFYLLIYGTDPSYYAPFGVGVLEIALTFLTLHGWWPSAFNSVVPGGWSIAVEISFYAVFPLLAVRLPTLNAILIAIGLSSGLALFLQTVLRSILTPHLSSWPTELIDIFFKFSFLRQAVFFLIGIAVYRWVVGAQRFRFDLRTCLLGLAATGLTYASLGRGESLVAGVLALFAVTVLQGRLGVTFVGALGRSSYSIYLVHFIVLSEVSSLMKAISLNQSLRALIGFSLVLVCSWLVALFTKRLIEDPGIDFGRFLLARRANSKAALC